MPRAMAQSPAALEGWMSLLEALAKGLLTKKLGASRRRAQHVDRSDAPRPEP